MFLPCTLSVFRFSFSYKLVPGPVQVLCPLRALCRRQCLWVVSTRLVFLHWGVLPGNECRASANMRCSMLINDCLWWDVSCEILINAFAGETDNRDSLTDINHFSVNYGMPVRPFIYRPHNQLTELSHNTMQCQRHWIWSMGRHTDQCGIVLSASCTVVGIGPMSRCWLVKMVTWTLIENGGQLCWLPSFRRVYKIRPQITICVCDKFSMTSINTSSLLVIRFSCGLSLITYFRLVYYVNPHCNMLLLRRPLDTVHRVLLYESSSDMDLQDDVICSISKI